MASLLTTERITAAFWNTLPEHRGHAVARWELAANHDIVNVYCSCSQGGLDGGWTAWISGSELAQATVTVTGPDYTAMSSSELLKACGDSGERWGDAFMQIVVRGRLAIDADVMRAWFANAIERACDERRWTSESARPPTAAQAESGPSAVRNVKPAKPRERVIYCQGEED